MSSAEIRITAEPIDNGRCKFLVSEPVHDGGVRRFASPQEASGSPLVEAIFAIPGAEVAGVIVSGNLVTVVKRSAAPWQVIGKPVGAAIRSALAGDRPAVAPKPAAPVAAGGADDDTLYDRVAELFDSQVNPMVARHGGRVELIDVQDAVVMLRMAGGCQGCGMADVTLRQGIEAMLQQAVPEVKGIVDITDHTAGANPVQRRELARHGVPVPRFELHGLDEDANALAAGARYPCVLKPLRLAASRGVIRADDPRGFAAAFERLTRIVEQAGCSRSILVEDFVPGPEVALEGLVIDGRLEVLGLFDKPDPLDGPFFEETIYVTPSRLPAPAQRALIRCGEAAVAALGVREGPIHAELRYNAQGPRLIELAARPIGGRCST